MTYREFSELVQQRLKDELGPNVTITLEHVKKNNSEIRDGLVIKDVNTTCAPTIYLKEHYQQNQEFGWSIEDSAKRIAEVYRASMSNAPDLSHLMANPKAKIFAEVINYEMNQERLKDLPHERYLDLAIIARYRVNDEATILVTKDFARSLGLTSEEIMEIAINNAKSEEYRCQNIIEVIKGQIRDTTDASEEYIDEMIESMNQPPMYVLTNKNCVRGSIALIFPEVLEKCAEQMHEESGLYIIGSSIHELILVPKTIGNPDEISNMINEVNSNCCDRQDQLTQGNVYEFNVLSRKVLMAPLKGRTIEQEDEYGKELGKKTSKSR